MSLSFFDVAGSFATGALEEAQRIDKDIADRIAKLSETKQSESSKTKFKAEYDKYNKDKILLRAVKSAGGAGEPFGQMLLGGYKNMEDYQAAVAANPELYHPLFEIGEEPVHNPAEYGITNVRKDGSKITTMGRIFNKLLQPEKFERTTKELAARKDKPATVTSYRRTVDEDGNWVNPTDLVTVEKNKAAIEARAVALQSARYRDELPDKMEVNAVDEDNNFLSTIQNYVKIPNPSKEYLESEEGKAAALAVGFPGYQKVGSPTFTENTELAQELRDLGPKPEDGDAEVLADWTFKNNTIRYGYATAHKIERDGRLDIGFIISGVYNEDDKEVSIQYTENPKDIFMEGTDFAKEGWIQVGKAKPDKTPTIDSTIDIYNAKDKTFQQVRYTGKGVSYTDYLGNVWEGYEVAGGPKPVEESLKFTTTTNALGEEVKLLHTGVDTDVVFKDTTHQRIGWIQIGFAKPKTGTSLKPMDLLNQAAADGKSVSDDLLAAARIEYSQRDSVIEQSIEAKLKMFDKLSVMVRDFSTLLVEKIVEEIGTDKVGTGVFTVVPNESEPATNAYIKVYAEYLGVTERVLKEALLQKILARDAKHKEKMQELFNPD